MSSTKTSNRAILRRADTGCSVKLSANLVPSSRVHNKLKCKCIAVCSDEDLSRLGETVKTALQEGILESEKPAVAFAMLLLGGEVVY